MRSFPATACPASRRAMETTAVSSTSGGMLANPGCPRVQNFQQLPGNRCERRKPAARRTISEASRIPHRHRLETICAVAKGDGSCRASTDKCSSLATIVTNSPLGSWDLLRNPNPARSDLWLSSQRFTTNSPRCGPTDPARAQEYLPQWVRRLLGTVREGSPIRKWRAGFGSLLPELPRECGTNQA